jgi:hypothetical protein
MEQILSSKSASHATSQEKHVFHQIWKSITEFLQTHFRILFAVPWIHATPHPSFLNITINISPPSSSVVAYVVSSALILN